MNSSGNNVLLCDTAFVQCFYLVHLICLGFVEIIISLCFIEIVQLALMVMLNMAILRIRKSWIDMVF